MAGGGAGTPSVSMSLIEPSSTEKSTLVTVAGCANTALPSAPVLTEQQSRPVRSCEVSGVVEEIGKGATLQSRQEPVNARRTVS